MQLSEIESLEEIAKAALKSRGDSWYCEKGPHSHNWFTPQAIMAYLSALHPELVLSLLGQARYICNLKPQEDGGVHCTAHVDYAPETKVSPIDDFDMENMAHSALQEALSHGLNLDVFKRFGERVAKEAKVAPAKKQHDTIEDLEHGLKLAEEELKILRSENPVYKGAMMALEDIAFNVQEYATELQAIVKGYRFGIQGEEASGWVDRVDAALNKVNERIPLASNSDSVREGLMRVIHTLSAEYWVLAQLNGKPGAVQWVTNKEGAMFVYTRGEHRMELQNFINSLVWKV